MPTVYVSSSRYALPELDPTARARDTVRLSLEPPVKTPHVELVPELGFALTAAGVEPAPTATNATAVEESWRLLGVPQRLARRIAADVEQHVGESVGPAWQGGSWTPVALTSADVSWLAGWRRWLCNALNDPNLGDVVERCTPRVVASAGDGLTTLAPAAGTWVPAGWSAWVEFGAWVAPLRLGRKAISLESLDRRWFQGKFTDEGRLRLLSFGISSLEGLLYTPSPTLFAALEVYREYAQLGEEGLASAWRARAASHLKDAEGTA